MTTVNSKVYSFRLHPDNPREARARLVYQQWREQGYSARHILTEALLLLGGANQRQETSDISDIHELLRTLLTEVRSGTVVKSTTLLDKEPDEGVPQLSEALLASIKANVRPGRGAQA